MSISTPSMSPAYIAVIITLCTVSSPPPLMFHYSTHWVFVWLVFACKTLFPLLKITSMSFSLCSPAFSSYRLDGTDRIFWFQIRYTIMILDAFATATPSKSKWSKKTKVFSVLGLLLELPWERSSLSEWVTKLVGYTLSSGRDPLGESLLQNTAKPEESCSKKSRGLMMSLSHRSQLCLESTTLGLPVIWPATFPFTFKWFWIGFLPCAINRVLSNRACKRSQNLSKSSPNPWPWIKACTWTRQYLPYHPSLISQTPPTSECVHAQPRFSRFPNISQYFQHYCLWS